MIKHLLIVAALMPAAMEAQTPTAAVSNVSPTLPIDRVVAIVGDQPLLWTDVLTAINQRRAQGLQIPTDSVQQAALARTVLGELIDEEILVQKAKEMKLEATESEITPAVDRQIKSIRAQFKSDDEYRTELRNAGFGTPDEYRKSLIEQYTRQNLQQKAFAELKKMAKPVNVSDEDVTAAFEQSRSELQKRPATVTFRQIIVAPHPSAAAKAKAKAKADSLLVEIRKGGDFEQIAKRESMDPGTKALGGDLGWNRRGSGLVPQFEAVMFALRPGEVSPVIETPFGYHIIRVDRVQSAEVKARHILIAPVIDSADVAAAKVEADSVAAQWRRGVSYDSLVAKHHDPTEEKGVLQPFNRDSLPASYQAALVGAKAGTITDPFQLANPRGQPKYAVLQVVTATDAGEYNVAEIRDQIRAQLADERSIRQLLDDLRKQTYVSIRM
ncbi:MAG TPA: peptidylprolyl isomerase [Gemmatimonadaceae bacterium]|jgi:peptidyl-prolyl cis-trans isomerase SurA|nr:peptidylprolyl isomerase [Gemmatimonadaceae bacterium]